MKLSNYIPLVALASLTSAVPASISVSVSVNDGSLRNSIHNHGDICNLPCFENQRDCGEGSYAWQSGHCWFCCHCSSRPHQTKKDEENFTKSLVAQGISDVGKNHPETMPLIHKGPVDICWRACFGSPAQCPKGWYSQKSGKCWTCCRCSSAPWDEITGTDYELPAETNAEIELLAADL